MRIATCVLLACALAAATGTVSARTLDASAKEVAADCRALLTATPPQTFGVGLCLGAFTTLFALSGVVDQNHVPILPFCRPPNVQYLDMVRVFLRHVAAHPEIAQNFYAVEAVNALVDAYPCKPK